MSVSANEIATALGGETLLGRNVTDPQDLRRRVSEGLPTQSATFVSHLVALDTPTRRAVLHRIVPEATFKRRQDRLSLAESERAERLARLATLTFAIWGEADGRMFLKTAHPMLAGETPLEAAATELGGREVEAILRALEFGLPM